MDKDKLKEVFNELLGLWESNEYCVINDRSINLGKDQDQLVIDKENFIKRFNEDLGEKAMKIQVFDATGKSLGFVPTHG